MAELVGEADRKGLKLEKEKSILPYADVRSQTEKKTCR